MKFEDRYFSKAGGYSLGVESVSGKYYVSMPVSNGIVDYEEYYEVSRDQYDELLRNRDAAIKFVGECRRHERDDLLIEKPGSNRGIPV